MTALLAIDAIALFSAPLFSGVTKAKDIYELPGARPYFELVQGQCNFHIEDRSTISANCSSQGQLVRRELYYPGWKASVGGRNARIEPWVECSGNRVSRFSKSLVAT
jgi:hypothetical protein